MKNIYIILAVVLILLVISLYFLNAVKSSKNILKISDKDIIAILQKNSDSAEYLKKRSDFKIESKNLLTIKNITDGQKAENFREVYQGLELQDNRYLKVDLNNTAGNNGLITIIDFKTGKAIKVFGKVLLTTGG